jgi:multisubunit Na+/H+ antiporter MnhG subunit
MLGAVLYQHGSAKFHILGMAIYLRELDMDTFWTIVVILVILWLVGFFALPGIGARARYQGYCSKQGPSRHR